MVSNSVGEASMVFSPKSLMQCLLEGITLLMWRCRPQAGVSGCPCWFRSWHCLCPLQNVCTQGFHSIQSLYLHQFGEQFWDAVAGRADAVEELHAVCHAANLIPLQPKALGQVAPRLHYGLLRVVGGAQHSARLLQAVKWQLCRAQTCKGRGGLSGGSGCRSWHLLKYNRLHCYRWIQLKSLSDRTWLCLGPKLLLHIAKLILHNDSRIS